MSAEAKAWVSSYAPDVPPHLVSTLDAFANYADDLGRGSAPTADVVAWHTRKKERQARADIAALEALGLIRRGNQDIVLHLPPDRRAVVYDLAMERTRGPRPEPSPSGTSSRKNRGAPHRTPAGTGVHHTAPRPVPGCTTPHPGTETGVRQSAPRLNRGAPECTPVDQARTVECTPEKGHIGNRGAPECTHIEGEEVELLLPLNPPEKSGLTAEESELHAEAMGVRSSWDPVVLADVLRDPAMRGRPDRALVRLAVLDAAADPLTFSPRRLLASGCTSWAVAEHQRFGDRKGEGRTAEPSAPREVPWCGSAECDITTRMRVDAADGVPIVKNGAFVPCPDCHPFPGGK